MIGVTIFAKASLLINRKYQKMPLPVFVYDFLGLPKAGVITLKFKEHIICDGVSPYFQNLVIDIDGDSITNGTIKRPDYKHKESQYMIEGKLKEHNLTLIERNFNGDESGRLIGELTDDYFIGDWRIANDKYETQYRKFIFAREIP
jgi:hypothetical protein